MMKALQAASALVDRKIGWHRIGLLISAMLIASACYALYHRLHGVRLQKILTAVEAKKFHEIAIAAVSVGCAYFTLTFYDLFALRTIGYKHIPYRIAALSGFTSYSFGHNVGATVFTGGAVRYRIYSGWGLTAVDVAKICFVAGLTFWLGNATVLGLGVLYAPQAASAVDQLPPVVNRVIAGMALVALASYIAWVWSAPRTLGKGGWRVTLPSGPSTLLQILIGIVDLGCCTLAMYMLVPDEPFIGFISLAVIFVTATMLGFASHSPGGIGVFDAAMMIALFQYDKEDLLAGLLLFRLLYYIIPFILCLILLGIRELIVSFRPPVVPPEVTTALGPLKSELGAPPSAAPASAEK